MEIRHCTKADYDEIIAHIEDFWGSNRTLGLHHPMFVYEFGNSAYVIEDGDCVAAYLFGFLSQTEPTVYVHLIGVRTVHRRQGLARCLYDHFLKFCGGSWLYRTESRYDSRQQRIASVSPGLGNGINRHAEPRWYSSHRELWGSRTESGGTAKKIEPKQPLSREISYGTWFEEIVVHRNFEDGCARNRHVAV